jgi:hypothetical protein
MRFYDIYNGDADGICALLQLRFSDPREAIHVTGVKRDIRLLDRIGPQPGDHLTVLDVSLDENRAGLMRALDAGAAVEWFDHHYAGLIPSHPGLTSHIDTDPRLCSSLIVDRQLGGQYRPWAIVAAFGDNLDGQARDLASEAGMSAEETELLRELGVCLNYNAYGEHLSDLRFAPTALYRRLSGYRDPLRFASEAPEFGELKRAYIEDLARAEALPIETLTAGCALVLLPAEPWSRRVVGVFANRLAQRFPQRAHAILVRRSGGYLVSVRAPLDNPRGAATVVRTFERAGGREGAAGIDHLPDGDVPKFLAALRQAYPG